MAGHHSASCARWSTQSSAWLLLRLWPGSPGDLAKVAGEPGCPKPSLSTLVAKACVPTGGLKVHLVTPDPVPSREGQGWKHQAVSMQKWEHPLMQRGGRQEEEGGSEKRGGGQREKEMERTEEGEEGK